LSSQGWEKTLQRSVGVTISAVVALLGSLLALGMALLSLLTLVVAPTPPPTPGFPASPELVRTIRFITPLFYLMPAAWGITTSIGLFRLRNWARISIIVFAALLAVWGLFGALTSVAMFAMPGSALPPETRLPPNFFAMVGVVVMVFALVQLGIAIWWLVFFNRAKVKQQFMPQTVAYAPYPAVAGTPPPPSIAGAPPAYGPQITAPPAVASRASVANAPQRPLSITIIAWYLLVVSLFVPINLLLRTPVPLFMSIVTGWPAMAYWVGMLGVHIYVGVGLLRLQPAARFVGIAYFGYSFINSVVFFFAPGGMGRLTMLLQAQQSVIPWMRPIPGHSPYPFDLRPFMMVGAVGGLILVLVPLCFLIINRPAFARSAASAA
jgi:hypothetical protein